MKTDKSKRGHRCTEPYLKLPYKLLSLPQIGLPEKVLLAHIYSFGAKGCWQSNQTLAEIFMVHPRSIKRWLAAIRKFLIIKNGKGYYRTIWAKTDRNSYWDKNGPDVGQNWYFNRDKNGLRVGRKCPTTINNTSKETIASPSPSPAKRAPATLGYSSFPAALLRRIELVKLSPQQFQQRRAKQLAALRKGNPIRQKFTMDEG